MGPKTGRTEHKTPQSHEKRRPLRGKHASQKADKRIQRRQHEVKNADAVDRRGPGGVVKTDLVVGQDFWHVK